MEPKFASAEIASPFPLALLDLIPCCQHASDSYKEDFETFVNSEIRHLLRQEQETPFLFFLLLHPRNQAFLRNVALKGIYCHQNNVSAALSPTEEAQFDEFALQLQLDSDKLLDYLTKSGLISISTGPKTLITWERLLILMRNILTHEYRFDWLWTRELAAHAEAYFLNWSNFQKITSSYARIVMGVTQTNSSPSPDLSRLLITFCGLIPCRSLNAIVDEQFCEEMDTLHSPQEDSQDPVDWNSRWETFAQWLKHHPANFEQAGADIQSYSWFVVVRLMRNVFCHESDFGWTALQDLAHQSKLFFGSLEGFEQLLKVYQKHCSLQNSSHYVGIQLYRRENCMFFLETDNAAFYIGSEHPFLSQFKSQVYYAILASDSTLQHVTVRVSGAPKSGRTLLAEKVIPRLLNDLKIAAITVVESENTLKRRKMAEHSIEFQFDLTQLERSPCAQ
eukprot:TRINITY_DN10601_c0_g1_i1.p1 TRINITY_DN10601_c0_g1~~TRINITY_DN10601_c0_g1_i1.p1  ORF type:complete len:449 (+),score=43.72 TRINITY_DN10601_c0_g1_i1:161-1507(+)